MPDSPAHDVTTQLPKLVQRLAEELIARNSFMACAESCTGGWIAQSLTALAGSSRWFDSGFITYSNAAKQRLLQVPAELFAAEAAGAVSEPVVRAMVSGALANSRATLAVAVSGIAGPDGGSPEKPVGTVWIGWQWQQRQVARRYLFSGDREAVRQATVVAALEGCLEILAGKK